MEEVQTFWEVPAISHFCSLFRSIFKLIDFDIENFEEALVIDSSDGGRSPLVVDLLIALLKGCTGRRDVSLLNYNQFLHDVLGSRWEGGGLGSNPLGTKRDNANFHCLPLYAKVKIFHCLCEWRLQRPDVDALTKNLNGDSLRVNPLGKGEDGATYWYFYGTRLYKEDPEPVKIKLLPPKKPPAAKNRKRPVSSSSRKGKKKKGLSKQNETQESFDNGGNSRKSSICGNSDSNVSLLSNSNSSYATPIRRSRRQAAKKGFPDFEDEPEMPPTPKVLKRGKPPLEPEDEKMEDDDTLDNTEEDTNLESGRSSRSTRYSGFPQEDDESCKMKRQTSRIKPQLKLNSGRSSPSAASETDGVISNRTIRDLIERMYSRDPEDDEDSRSAISLDNGNNGHHMAPSPALFTPEEVDNKKHPDDEEVSNVKDGEESMDFNNTTTSDDHSNDDRKYSKHDDSSLLINSSSALESENTESSGEHKPNCSIEIPKEELTEKSATGDDKQKEAMLGSNAKPEDEENPVEEEETVEEGPPAWDQPLLKPDASVTSRWHLVCHTFEHWKETSLKWGESKAKCEKDLYQLVQEEFLPEIEEMFVQKEKDQQREMAEMSRRASGRLEMKKLQREAEVEELHKRETAEKDRIAKLEWDREKKIEKEERERRTRLRELERGKAIRMKERAREERARRLNLRQQRVRLIQLGEEIPDDLKGKNASFAADDEELNELDIELELERMYGQLEKVLDIVKNSSDSDPFQHPVLDHEAPDYSIKIETPMDLDTMEAKLLDRQYKTKGDFIDDLNLIFVNCLEYNGLDSEYTKMAQKVERNFIKGYRKHFPPSEVIENERARKEEWECLNKLGALDKKIRDKLEPPPPPPPEPKKLTPRSRTRTTPPYRPPTNKSDSPDKTPARVPAVPTTSLTSVTGSSSSPMVSREISRPRQILSRPPPSRLPPSAYQVPDNMRGARESPKSAAYRASSCLPGRLTPQTPLATSTPVIGRSLYTIRDQAPTGGHQPLSLPPTTQHSVTVSNVPSASSQRTAQPPRQTFSTSDTHTPSPARKAGGEDQRPNVYVLPTKDGNRLLKFVTRHGQPASHDLVTHLLPQLRKEAHKLPKGLLTLTVDAEQIDDDNNAGSPSTSSNIQGGVQTQQRIVQTQRRIVTNSAATHSTPQRIQTQVATTSSAGKNDQLAATLLATTPSGTAASITGSPSATQKRFYDMGENSFLAIEDGNPYLYKRQPDGTLVKLHQVSRDGLVEKLKRIQDRRKQQRPLPPGPTVPPTTVPAQRPVCSVAPQPQQPPLNHPPRIQQSLSVPAQIAYRQLPGSKPSTYASTSTGATMLVPAGTNRPFVQSQASVSASNTGQGPSHQVVYLSSPVRNQGSGGVSKNDRKTVAPSSGTQVILQGSSGSGTYLLSSGNSDGQFSVSSSSTPTVYASVIGQNQGHVTHSTNQEQRSAPPPVQVIHVVQAPQIVVNTGQQNEARTGVQPQIVVNTGRNDPTRAAMVSPPQILIQASSHQSHKLGSPHPQQPIQQQQPHHQQQQQPLQIQYPNVTAEQSQTQCNTEHEQSEQPQHPHVASSVCNAMELSYSADSTETYDHPQSDAVVASDASATTTTTVNNPRLPDSVQYDDEYY